ncbi:GNAT family N-acetyltransferase [uncultured Ferrimonas sp.]|uniref:GNAT family N-acetyltransferase n=1 Tax=uncultured Ferrimonas sp. TaxID=432640 RepID=UPI002630432A|nr:GNAT family N-acetyltransferase [uncultured Ferrimonas sp.]
MSFIIETERLGLRQFTLDDAPAVLAFSSNEQVTEYTGDAGMIASIDDAEHVIRTIWLKEYRQHGYARYALVHKADNKVIGFAGWKFIDEDNMPDLGYRMLPQYWGQGLGFEIALACMHYGKETLEFNHVFADALPDNLGSCRIIEKLGFRYQKQYHFSEDGFDLLINRYVADLRQWQPPQS